MAASTDKAVEFTHELMAFIGILASEGERSLVIGGAARIDVAVERLLKGAMSHSPRGKDDNLFDPDRPLGTFSAKINLAHRLGLLDDELEHTLQLIRKVRNDFAHATHDIRLLQPSHADRVREIVKCVQKVPVFNRTHERFVSIVSTRSRNVKRNELLASLAVAVLFVALAIELSVWKNDPMKPKFVASFEHTPKGIDLSMRE